MFTEVVTEDSEKVMIELHKSKFITFLSHLA
jgi:hypothetical protein